MPRPLRIEFPGAIYHVFSRGNDKKDIFFSDEDRELFLAALDEACLLFDVSIHSYCLMSNHIHLLLETKQANLSHFMKRLLGVYTIRFNRTHKRVGHLFQGRYRAHLVDRDEYLLQVSRYIHLNPVKAGMIDVPEVYAWSSLKFYISSLEAPRFLDKNLILGSFLNWEAYLQFVREGIGREVPLVINKPLGGIFIGSKDYANTFRQRLANETQDFRRKEYFKIPLDILQETLEMEEPDLHAYALWRFGQRGQGEISELTSKSQSAISHAIKRFKDRLDKDKKLKTKVDGIGIALSYFME